ncbi:MAG: lysylphosphatidylglycerol synthetase family protein [Acetobacteraceae bacterium]|nr:lysylphosphatidylglycerol synthetase family protein [Acetobacteraceae bacterium]
MAGPQTETSQTKGLTRYLSHLPAVLGVLLLIGALYVVQKEFRHLRLKDIGDALRAIPTAALVFSFVWTILSYFILTFYDRLGTIYAGHKVSYGRVAFASFCAYSLAHNLGFAAVSGAAVRYRLYAHWGLTPFQIGKTVAFCSLTFALGGLVLGGAILFIEPTTIPFFGQHVPVLALHAVGAVLWAIVIAYITLSRVLGSFHLRGHEIDLPRWRMALLQVVLATVDVAVTATIFYALLPNAPGLTWTIFLGVYVASYTAGLAANLPGGIGVFDTAMLFGLEPYVDAPHIVGAIVVFRLYYYIIPLFLAGGLFAGNEILLRGGALARVFGMGPSRAGPATRWSEPDFAVAASTGLVGICGAMLLTLGVIAPNTDYSWLDPEFADIAFQAGQFVPSLIGAGLVIMALGLSQRVNLAWGVTIALLLVGAGFAATQDNQLWVVVMLILCAASLAPFRSCFYRHASLLSGPFEGSTAMSLLVLVICVLALVLARHQTVLLNNNAWWAVVMAREVPNSVRFAVASAVILASIAIWLLVRPGRVRALPWDAAAARRLFMVGSKTPVHADGLITGEADRAALPFRRVGRVLLGLGDPAGAEADKISAVWRLRDLARQEGLDPAFWRVGPDLLKVYADLGLTPLPLDADGQIVESDGTPDPSRRYLVCMAERDLNALIVLLPELAAIPAK